MAKRKTTDEGFPYFKFFISKWSTGNIQQCSLSSQGLFMNLCVLYWGQRGDLYLSKMKKRFQRKQKHFEELVSENVIKLIGDKIEITFLDEQFEELGLVSEKNRENANKRWNQNKSDATVSISQCNGNAMAMPIEEKREEEKREEDILHLKKVPRGAYSQDDFYTNGQQAFEEIQQDEQMVERMLIIIRRSGFNACNEITLMKAVRFFITVEEAKPEFKHRPRDEIKKHLINWITLKAKNLNQYG